MKAVIFYFSGTGNTWWLTKTLKEKLDQKGIQTDTVNIEDPHEQYLEKISEYDYIGFGYPIYGSDCPLNYRRFLEKLPRTNNKPAFIYTSMLAFSGDGALVAEKHLKKQGYNVKQAVNTVMMNNIKLPYPIMSSLPIYNKEEMEKIREKAEKRMEKLANKIVIGEEWIEGRGILGIMGGMMQRSFVAVTGWSRWAKNFYVDQEACINCDQCIEYCPTGNIMVENSEYVWGEKCICCVRCYNLCPTDAIQYKQATMNREKYPRFKGPIKDFTPSLQRK